MTTGMRSDQTTVERRRGPRVSWIWIVFAAIVAIALVGYATTPKAAKTGWTGTPGSVQNSGTGQQGSVGKFSNQVVPQKEGNNPQGGINATGNNPPGTPSAPIGQEGTGASARDMGAGNSGITTATDSLGGSTTKGNGQDNAKTP